MKDTRINRKEFLRSAGRMCTGSCLCAIGLSQLLAQKTSESDPGAKTAVRAVKRMEFVDKWIKRFIDVLDKALDEEKRREVMMTNGKVCFQEWIKSTGREIKAESFENWAARIKEGKGDGSVRVEGNVIYFEYRSSAEVGKPTPKEICLCPLVESKPAGLSSTYCLCSLGYVKESFEQRFARTVDVELLDSVLYRGKRCKFKVTVQKA